jgi:hypothetical protein
MKFLEIPKRKKDVLRMFVICITKRRSLFHTTPIATLGNSLLSIPLLSVYNESESGRSCLVHIRHSSVCTLLVRKWHE